MRTLKEKQHICIGCSKKFPESEITYAPDPFDEEINGNETNVWECDDCRYQSAMDI